MHAILMDRDRPKVGTPIEEFGKRAGIRRLAFLLGEAPALARHTEATMKAAAYAATWDIHGSDVVHHVMASVLPDWIGTDLVPLMSSARTT
jgi:Lipocalin-like domain